MRLIGSLNKLLAVVFRKDNQNITLLPNQDVTYDEHIEVELPPEDADQVLLSENAVQSITNKNITDVTNNISATILTSGTIPAARVPSSAITQHVGELVHQSLSGVGTNDHSAIDSHIGNVTTNPHAVTKSNINLGNVDNIQQLPLSYLDTDATLAADSDEKVPSQKAIKTALETSTFTIAGKSIDADNNTITNLSNSAIGASAAIAWSKLAAGSTTNRMIQTNTSTGLLEEVSAAPYDGGYLKFDGTDYVWDTPDGGGDVLGPATSADTTVAVFDGTDNKTIKGTYVSINSSNNIYTTGYLSIEKSADEHIRIRTIGETAYGRILRPDNGLMITDNLYLSGASWVADDDSKPSAMLLFDSKYNAIKFHTAAAGAGAKTLLSPFTITMSNGYVTFGTPASFSSTSTFTGAATFSTAPIFNNISANRILTTDGSKHLSSITATGSGSCVLSTNPTIFTPIIRGGTIYTGTTITNNGTIAGGTLSGNTINSATISSGGSGITNSGTISGGSISSPSIISPTFSGTLSGIISSGTWNPVFSGKTGVTDVSGMNFTYTRIGNIVTFSGLVDYYDASTTGSWSFEMDLPISRIDGVFTNDTQAIGIGYGLSGNGYYETGATIRGASYEEQLHVICTSDDDTEFIRVIGQYSLVNI